jgi:outer membrane protein OmpA-like peptidoglycan-associated protein
MCTPEKNQVKPSFSSMSPARTNNIALNKCAGCLRFHAAVSGWSAAIGRSRMYLGRGGPVGSQLSSRREPSVSGPTESGPTESVSTPEPEVAQLGGNSAASDQLSDRWDISVPEHLDQCVETPSLDELDAIDALVADVRSLLSPWAAQRRTTDYRFDTGALDTRLESFAVQMRSMLASSSGDTDRPAAWFQTPRIRAALRERLATGTIRDAIYEITQFNQGLTGYADLLAIDDDRLTHTYTLTLLGGGAIGVGRAVRAELRYENARGMSWTTTAEIVFLQTPDGVSYELPGDPMSNDPTSVYFSPDDFAGARVETLSVEVGVSRLSAGGEAYVFHAPSGQRLTFHSTHGIETQEPSEPDWSIDPDDGPDLSPMSATAGEGHVVGAEAPVVSSVLPELRDDGPVASTESVIDADLYFATGSAALDGADRRTLDSVVGAIISFERHFPGTIFRVSIQGLASRRWASARDDVDREARNRELASARATVARDALASRVRDPEMHIDTSVAEASLASVPMSTATSAEEDPASNLAEERRVHIEVRIDPCSPDRLPDR